MRDLLFLIILMTLASSCLTPDADPRDNKQQKQLQSMELHYPWGQIVHDSLFYNDALLSRHTNRSTNQIGNTTYRFGYSTLSIEMYRDRNGISSVDFVRKDIFNDNKQLIQTIIKRPDGSLFSTSDFIYNAEGRLVARMVSSKDLNFTDSIQVDNRGNQIFVKSIHDQTVIMDYDQYPNPFYRSPINISTFRTDTPNNMTRFRIFYADTLFYEKTYQYQYGPDNYPTKVVVQGSFSNDAEEEYYFYYE
ncbi:MAG: hypothetical protein ACR2MX_02925 [Cyclobacteriaceae bacterium]